MSEAARAPEPATPLLPELPACCAAAADGRGRAGRRGRATGSPPGWSPAGRVSNAALEADQVAAHGLAWMATYAESAARARGLGRAARGRGRASARSSG